VPNDWTTSEKKIARRVFERALGAELAEVMNTFKTMAASAALPDDMWSAEAFLANARRSIDRKYDYRYSQLLLVFGQLLREGRITEEELSGLADDKVQAITRVATL
jgi:hypothetical protein